MDARTCGLHQEARKRVARSVPCPTRVWFEEEEGDVDVRAQFVSETEREGRQAASAGARGLLG